MRKLFSKLGILLIVGPLLACSGVSTPSGSGGDIASSQNEQRGDQVAVVPPLPPGNQAPDVAVPDLSKRDLVHWGAQTFAEPICKVKPTGSASYLIGDRIYYRLHGNLQSLPLNSLFGTSCCGKTPVRIVIYENGNVASGQFLETTSLEASEKNFEGYFAANFTAGTNLEFHVYRLVEGHVPAVGTQFCNGEECSANTVELFKHVPHPAGGNEVDASQLRACLDFDLKTFQQEAQYRDLIQ